MNKLLIICGPTATGKTDLGISLAQKFNGEIISADSRQVYKGMDIVTGKDIPENSKFKSASWRTKLGIENNKLSVGYRLKNAISIWLVDIVDPDYPFNVGEYTKLANKVIADIQLRGKLPIVVGGTGLYIQSLITPLSYVMIPPNTILRKQLEQLNKPKLQQEFGKLNPDWWNRMNNSDKNNSRRLIRAIEVTKYQENHNISINRLIDTNPNRLLIGLMAPKEILFERINKRVEQRIKDGAINEVKNLLKKGYSWDLISFSSTGIRQLKDYFDNKESLDIAVEKWKLAEHQFAKGQITWFKKTLRESQGKWFDITDANCKNKIVNLVKKWYTGSQLI